jgi:hypothetical protein
MADLMVSYAREDAEFVRTLQRSLQAHERVDRLLGPRNGGPSAAGDLRRDRRCVGCSHGGDTRLG